jgi:hypothetical protein
MRASRKPLFLQKPKENTMHQYQTLALQFIREFPGTHYPLKDKKMLQATVEKEAEELASCHKFWIDSLSLTQPDSDPISIESAALELALKELEDRLRAELPKDDQEEPLSLEGAMAFLRRATPPA